MPELPEVETIKNDLCRRLIGRRFTGVAVSWEGSIAQPSADEFRRRLIGQQILDVGRRGKYLIFSLSGDKRSRRSGVKAGDEISERDHLSGGDSLVVHLKMTGQLLLRPATTERDKYTRLVFDLDDGQQLRFADMRKFGRLSLLDQADLEALKARLGPEPLADDFALDDFVALFERRRGWIKPLLVNQEFIAGLGNVYADEALFYAGLHPLRQANTLTPAEMERLYRAMRWVLRWGIENRGTTFDGRYRDVEGNEGRHQSELAVYRRTGEPCLKCGTPIERLVIGGRSAHFCPRCQMMSCHNKTAKVGLVTARQK